MKQIVSINAAAKIAFKTVEWTLHNVCNYSCSFCSAEYNSGSKRWLTIDEYKRGVDKIISEAQQDGQRVWFKITGGEPTLYPELLELLVYIKQQGGYTFMISNGSRTLRWWKELADIATLDILNITYHPEQTNDLQHVINVSDFFGDTATMAFFSITTLPHLFDHAVLAHNEIIQRCNTVTASLSIIASNEPLAYSDTQLEAFRILTQTKSDTWNFKRKWSDIPMEYRYKMSEIILHYDDDTTEKSSGALVLKNQKNQFNKWNCSAGKNNAKIISNDVYRAVCLAGPKKDISTDSIFYNDSVECEYNSCDCILDIAIEKHKNYIPINFITA